MDDFEELIQRRCSSKQWFKSEQIAQEVAKKVSNTRNQVLRAYKCFDCGGWHLTHTGFVKESDNHYNHRETVSTLMNSKTWKITFPKWSTGAKVNNI